LRESEAGDGGLREKSNTQVRIEIKITPKANIQKCLSHRTGCLSALIAPLFIMTRGRLIFRLRDIVWIENYFFSGFLFVADHNLPLALLPSKLVEFFLGADEFDDAVV